MKVTYNNIIEAYRVLNGMKDKPFEDGIIAIYIGLLLDTITTHYFEYSAKEKEIIEKYCEKDENGMPVIDEHGNYRLADIEAREPANKELTALVSTEVEINDIFKLPLNSFKMISMTPNEAMALKMFIQI